MALVENILVGLGSLVCVLVSLGFIIMIIDAIKKCPLYCRQIWNKIYGVKIGSRGGFRMVKVIKWLYYIFACIIVVPWFIGAIFRQEQSFSVFIEAQRAYYKYGLGDCVVAILLYLIFYSALIVLPYKFFKYFKIVPKDRGE